MSKLDPNIYGSPESALTTELVESQIKGSMTVKQALKDKRLFIIDYHDAFMLYVKKVREIKGRTLYGSRTLFIFDDESLRPLAIELTRPPMNGKPQWKQVYTPGTSATSYWVWKLAKAHALANDSAYHQLISHWLRTHCCTEPYIIAANRQLSAMHPIYRLLHPYFRDTMEINAFGRENLINAGGIIESTFSPQKYAIEISSIIYGLEWRFDHEALPADLISRGMAVEDASSSHGLKLTIEDYPYASDGLELWSILKQWVADYVNHYYSDPTLVESDEELQAWWMEVRTVGHGDKKDEPWWPNLKTPQDLIHIITTIIWVASAHHAAANFGQYDYAGYFPNRPTITRTKMPTEDPTGHEWNHFLEKPEETLLQCYPSPGQATTVMMILDVLSSHSSDEEYIGQKAESAWEAEPKIKAAYEKFKGRMIELEGIIDERNANQDLKNRNSAGVMPYELLKPLSLPGVTAKGVPNSISI
ncbi:Linoleate 13S-lipoxygenase 2-1 chloroplastic [Bienertia sinuspersici]